MSIRSIRPMSTKKWPTAAQLEAEREPNIPKDLHPNFYKLKADQKLYQVHILICLFYFSCVLLSRL